MQDVVSSLPIASDDALVDTLLSEDHRRGGITDQVFLQPAVKMEVFPEAIEGSMRKDELLICGCCILIVKMF